MGSSIDLSQIAVQIPPKDRNFHREVVADILKRTTVHFPGAQPVSFARHHLEELENTDYFMCEKTDGVRCLLFLTQLVSEEGGIEAQFLIDRKNEYWYVPRDTLHMPRPEDVGSFHDGTILDGELVRQRKPNGQTQLSYLIFDCLAISRENIMNRPFDKRLARIETLVWKPWRDFAKRYPTDVASQPFLIEMKKMEFPYAMEMMFREKIPTLPHGNDGLVFTCKETPYIPGTDQHILKWKPPQENTVDFRLLLGDFPMLEDGDDPHQDWDAIPPLELHVNHGGNYAFFAQLQLHESEWEAFKKLNQQLDGRILECYRDPRDSRWRPKVEKDGSPRFRDDKTDANHISVVNSVLESIKDAVSEQDLIAEAGKIRSAFKERQRVRAEEAKRVEEARRTEEAARRAEAERRRSEEAITALQNESSGQKNIDPADLDDGPRYDD